MHGGHIDRDGSLLWYISDYAFISTIHRMISFAFLRHMEVWGVYNSDIISRGLLAKSGIKRSFAGRIGHLYDKKAGAVIKRGKTWYVCEINIIRKHYGTGYKLIGKLSSAGADAIKARAGGTNND